MSMESIFQYICPEIHQCLQSNRQIPPVHWLSVIGDFLWHSLTLKWPSPSSPSIKVNPTGTSKFLHVWWEGSTLAHCRECLLPIISPVQSPPDRMLAEDSGFLPVSLPPHVHSTCHLSMPKLIGSVIVTGRKNVCACDWNGFELFTCVIRSYHILEKYHTNTITELKCWYSPEQKPEVKYGQTCLKM